MGGTDRPDDPRPAGQSEVEIEVEVATPSEEDDDTHGHVQPTRLDPTEGRDLKHRPPA